MFTNKKTSSSVGGYVISQLPVEAAEHCPENDWVTYHWNELIDNIPVWEQKHTLELVLHFDWQIMSSEKNNKELIYVRRRNLTVRHISLTRTRRCLVGFTKCVNMCIACANT